MIMMGMMGMLLLWSIMGIAVLVLAVIGVVTMVRRLSGPEDGRAIRPPAADAADPAQAELRRRYAAGEISREEYLQGKVDLE